MPQGGYPIPPAELVVGPLGGELCGYRKPNKAGLEYISGHFGVDIADLIFVGDEKLDIDTAKNAGCKSVLIDRNHKQEPCGQDYTIQVLTDIFSISFFEKYCD